MSESEPTDASEQANATNQTLCPPRGPRWKRVLKGLGIGIGATVVTIVLLGVLVYDFGGMSGSAVPGIEGQYARLVESGQAQPIRNRFVIPIPGCRCHSKDPVLTAQHSRRHMNECAKCHNTNPAHMEPGVL